MQSFDFQIVLNCPLETVFAIYLDTERWCNRNLFGEIRWVQGKPWEYIFYVDAQIHSTEEGSRAIQALSSHCSMVKELGRYKEAPQ